MRRHNYFAIWALSACTQVFANAIALPLPYPHIRTLSCTIEPLIPDTWRKLDIDTWLKDWVAESDAHEQSNIQGFADSLGAPNFFCGIDRFCNAGQPCIPVKLPAWYALLGIQTWNNYMNSISTAVIFASATINSVLPEVIEILYDDPRDDVTGVKELVVIFNMIVAIIPVTGHLGALRDNSTSGLDIFLKRIFRLPAPTDAFVAWSNLGGTLSTMEADYQKSILATFQEIINTPIGAPGGINAILSGGEFLGISPRITQADFDTHAELQKTIIDVVSIYAITLALRAQKMFVQVTYSEKSKGENCHDLNEAGPAAMCVERDGGWTGYFLARDNGGSNEFQNDIADKLINNYGFTKEKIFAANVKCFVDNGRKQVTDVFETTVVVNATTPCLFYIEVREST